jgi:uncharacterized protein (DUF427 family)
MIREILLDHCFSSNAASLIVANRALFPVELRPRFQRFSISSNNSHCLPLRSLGQSGLFGDILICQDSFATEKCKMPKAIWGGKTIAESDATVVVEGNQYFPPEAVSKTFLKLSNHTSVCPWKGTARYYHVEVDGIRNDNAAWYYPEPKPAAAEIKDRIAFWKGVRVEA